MSSYNPTPFTYIDLFCGIGGFHQAMKNLGGECIFASDIDKDCRIKSNFQCSTSDGGFNRITDDNNNLLPNIRNYINTIASLFGLDQIEIPQHYILHKGIACRTRWLDIFKDDFLKDYTICGHKIFSYAFIYGPDNDGQTNFSFTIDMK